MTGNRVLLVEDEGVVRMVTAEMLRDSGFAVIEAASGEEALALIGQDEHFDVLLTDVRMPGMDGLDLARRVRDRFPTMPVLIVSGYSSSLAAGVGTISPPTEWVKKPYVFESIVDTVKRLMAAD